jgi:hypothetical protein
VEEQHRVAMSVPEAGGQPVAFGTGEFHRVRSGQVPLRASVIYYIYLAIRGFGQDTRRMIWAVVFRDDAAICWPASPEHQHV